MKIYLVKKQSGLVKIGITDDFNRRLGEIRRKHGKKSRRYLVLSLWWAKHYESALHKRYDHLRVLQDNEREWFRLFAFRPAFWILWWWLCQTSALLLAFLAVILPYLYILFY